jgi:hypothetical protein
VKNFAISTFGSHDKAVLVAGILVVLAVFAALIGVASLRRLAYGLAGLVVFTLIGLAAVLTRPDHSSVDALPVLIGAAAGAFTMVRLVRAADADQALPASPAQRGPAGQLADSATPAPGVGDVPAAAGGPPAPGTSWVPSGPPTRAASRPQPGRRRFLITGLVAVGVAGVSAVIGQRLAGPSSAVARARTTLRLPRPARPAAPLAGASLISRAGAVRHAERRSYRWTRPSSCPGRPASWQLRIHGMVDREIAQLR